MINPGSIAIEGYLGDTLSVATDGYISPSGDNPFVMDFVTAFVGNFVGDFVSAFTDNQGQT